MTEKKLNSIYDALVDKYDGELSYDFVLEAMKQAVNEALEEAAEKAEAWVDDNGEWISLKVEAKVSKQSILNLKVK